MSDRVKTITQDLIEAVRNVLIKHEVTFPEYRAGFAHLVKTQEAGEIPLLLDVYLNSTIVEIENKKRAGSKATLQGPYFLEDAPVCDTELGIRDEDKDQPRMILRGKVTDLSGQPVAGAVIDVWHSTPDGKYSGIHDGIPMEFYRGKLVTDDDGNYEVQSILPVPYQIPNTGPTGALLETHLEYHSWRPAHIHYWVHADGLRDLISQAYFEGGDWVDDDCCNGVADEFIVAEAYEDGVRVMEVNFRLDPAEALAQAAE